MKPPTLTLLLLLATLAVVVYHQVCRTLSTEADGPVGVIGPEDGRAARAWGRTTGRRRRFG